MRAAPIKTTLAQEGPRCRAGRGRVPLLARVTVFCNGTTSAQVAARIAFRVRPQFRPPSGSLQNVQDGYRRRHICATRTGFRHELSELDRSPAAEQLGHAYGGQSAFHRGTRRMSRGEESRSTARRYGDNVNPYQRRTEQPFAVRRTALACYVVGAPVMERGDEERISRKRY